MKKLLQNEWQLLLFSFLMHFFSIGGQTAFISLFGGYIREDLSLSHSQFGGFYSTATFMSALLLIYTGKLTDRVDLKKLSMSIIILLSIACLMMANVTYTLLLVVFLMLRHSGQGLLNLIGTTAVVRYIKNHRGKATSLTNVGYSCAEGLMPIVVANLLVFMHWRSIWLLFASLLLTVMLPLAYFLLKNHHVRHKKYLHSQNHPTHGEQEKQASLVSTVHFNRRQVIKDTCFYMTLSGLLATPLLFTGLFFHQIQMLNEKNWTLEWWSQILLLYSVVGILSIFIAGFLIDRFSARKVVLFVPPVLGVGLVFLSLAQTPFMAIVAMTFIAIASASSSTVSSPLFVELYGTKHIGSIKSLTVSAMVFSSSIAPFVIGILLDSGYNFDHLFLAGAIYCLVTSLLGILSYKLKNKQFFQPTRTQL